MTATLLCMYVCINVSLTGEILLMCCISTVGVGGIVNRREDEEYVHCRGMDGRDIMLPDRMWMLPEIKPNKNGI